MSNPQVAPFAGAWIEILAYNNAGELTNVAPFAGAWIEIIIGATQGGSMSGRPLRGGVD